MAEERAAAGPLDAAGRVLPRDRVVILNVDDYEAGRYATSRVLRQAGFDVVEAATGEEAVTRAVENPDLIVLDVNLPDFDGFEVCRRIREMPSGRGIPIVYLSALYHDAEHRVLGLEVGADAYLKQPVEPRELVATIHALLRARAVEAAVRASEHRFRTLVETTSQVIWTTTAAGEMEGEQASWQAFSGQEPAAFRGMGWLDAVHPDDRARVGEGWRAAVAARTPYEAEMRLRRADGCYREMWLRAAPVPHADGSVREWVGASQDVTDRRRIEHERDHALEAAQQARADAEEASRAKSGFLANMSHEIRTPINAIIGYTDLLQIGVAGELTDAQRAHLERVRLSSRHLLTLIEDILDLSKIESGQMAMSVRPGTLAAVVEAALALVIPQATEKGLEIENRAAAARSAAYLGDEDRVRQVLVNLLSNAVKFTAHGGRVAVEAGLAEAPARVVEGACTGPCAYIRVEDTGPGIERAQLDAVFEPFVQGESGHTRTKGGTGLGLTISRHLARLMGGDVTVESVVGQGSAFTVWLPRPASGLAPADAAPPAAAARA
jgi:PAS domain S-box-containing protein